MSSPFGSNVFHCCQRYCVDFDDVWSVTAAYIYTCCRTADIELLSKVQMILELLCVRDGHYTFDNFTSLTISDADAVSFIVSICILIKLCMCLLVVCTSSTIS